MDRIDSLLLSCYSTLISVPYLYHLISQEFSQSFCCGNADGLLLTVLI